ncbi:MAG: hypothetical protein ACLRWF_11210 [Ruthenibacterium sp.]
MVGGGEGLVLPLRIYLGGAGRYDEVMSNAANLYAFGSALNHAPTGTLMRGAVPFATVNAVFWAGIALGLAVYAVWLWRACAAAPALCEPRFCTISRCSFSPSACASAICCLRWRWRRCVRCARAAAAMPCWRAGWRPPRCSTSFGAALCARRAA